MVTSKDRSTRGTLVDGAFYRLGTGAIGAVVGLVLGGLLFLPMAALRVVESDLGPILIGGAIAGAVLGVAIPRAAFVALEGLVNFIAGCLASVLGEGGTSPEQPGWIRAAFWVGALFALLMLVIVKSAYLFSR